MPAVVRLSEWLIQTMEKAGEEEREVQLKLASRIKGLANRMKNYQGKLKGMHNLGLSEKRYQREEVELNGIQNPGLRREYQELRNEMARVYQEQKEAYPLQHFISSVSYNWNVLSAASSLVEYAHERTKKDQNRESMFMTRNLERTRERLIRSVKNIHVPVDQKIAEYLFRTLGSQIPKENVPPALMKFCSVDGEDLKELISASYDKRLLDPEAFGKWFDNVQLDHLKKSESAAVKLALELYPLRRGIKDREDKWKGRLDSAMARWLDIKQQLEKENFLPDANSTLRLTWGRVKGYSPRDAVFMRPFTVLSGMIEKSLSGGDYQLQEHVRALIDKGGKSSFYQKSLNGVPVNFLYDADTTGGNSGSPVLNAKGELVGVNFDRAFEATINDFAWDEGYSRSIGLDIRFVLWYIESTGGGHLLDEMGVR